MIYSYSTLTNHQKYYHKALVFEEIVNMDQNIQKKYHFLWPQAICRIGLQSERSSCTLELNNAKRHNLLFIFADEVYQQSFNLVKAYILL
jgi:hypothetical protein